MKAEGDLEAAPQQPQTQQHKQQQQQHHQHAAALAKHVSMGLTIAGIASAVLTTIFRMFHVDVFLRAYELPLTTYSRALSVFSIVHTANNLAGAWIVDHLATRMDRSHLIGVSGCIFSLAFLTPFFRWQAGHSSHLDGLHFITSMSLYDTLYAFTAILLGSVFTDSHNLTPKQRVQFMASGKVANLVASFVVARIGLELFDVKNLYRFRVFLILLALLSAGFFVYGQAVILGTSSASSTRSRFFSIQWYKGRIRFLSPSSSPSSSSTFLSSSPSSSPSSSSTTKPSQLQKSPPERLRRRRIGSSDNINVVETDDEEDDSIIISHHGKSSSFDLEDNQNKVGSSSSSRKKLQWRRVVHDFWTLRNFRAWAMMEMLLEAQVTFSSTFLKTFVDRLVMEESDRQLQQQQQQQADGGQSSSSITASSSTAFSRETCDWLLSMIGPLSQVFGIFCYIPIRRVGYPRVYKSLFMVNLLLSMILLLVADGSCTYWSAFFLTVYPILTAAVQSAGFHLAMSDMVLEMKRRHFMEGRYNEPSLAALFMGANALFCKPMETLLPIIAASVMGSTSTTTAMHSQQQDQLQQHDDDGNISEEDMVDDVATKNKFFYLLVLPPFFFSMIQLLVWQGFNLTPTRTAAMRQDLRHLQQQAAAIAAKEKKNHHVQKKNASLSSSPSSGQE